MQDITELIGVLMRVVGGGEASVEEVEHLTFDCADYLLPMLNEAFIALLEFAHDHDLRARDMQLEAASRAELDGLLGKIARLTEEPLEARLSRSGQRAELSNEQAREDQAA
jgi:hypothetical protein